MEFEGNNEILNSILFSTYLSVFSLITGKTEALFVWNKK